MNIIGFDPGNNGALAVITPARDVRLFSFHNQSERDIAHIILSETLEPCYAYLEKVGARPKQGVTSMFTFGQNLGFLRGLLVGYGIPFQDVTPQVWQRGISIGKAFPTPAERKRAHYQLAQQLYPQVKFNLAMADALLIAEYGRRTYRQQ